MSDFIKFVAVNADNAKTGEEFSNIMNSSNLTNSVLQGWFKERGFDITLQECQELIDNKTDIINHLKRDMSVKY